MVTSHFEDYGEKGGDQGPTISMLLVLVTNPLWSVSCGKHNGGVQDPSKWTRRAGDFQQKPSDQFP